MKIGLFRGSFDPPHMGHVFAAVQALQTLNLDQVWVLPVYSHPFGKSLSDYKIRLDMVTDTFFRMGDIMVKTYDENNTSGHCIELLKHIKNRWPTNEYIMLGGSDVASQNDKYKDKDEVLKLCTVARVPRAEYSQDKFAIPNYSSSEIKERVRNGLSISGLVPATVEAIILKHNLYKEFPVVSKSG